MKKHASFGLALCLISLGAWTAIAEGAAQPTARGFGVEVAPVEAFGAAADCSTDNTASVQAALDAGVAALRFGNPAACYKMDTVRLTRPVKIIIEPGVVVMRATANCGDSPLFFGVDPAASGSEIGGGGVLDGARGALAPTCLAGWRPEWRWDAFFFSGVHRLHLHDLTLRNFAHVGVNLSNSDDSLIENIKIERSSVGLSLQYVRRLSVRGVGETSMGNAGAPIYQHINEIRGASESTFDGLTLDGWSPDASGLEPVPSGFSFQLVNSHVSNLIVKGFSGKGGVGHAVSESVGVGVADCVSSTFDRLTVIGNAHAGVYVNGAIGCAFSMINIDGAGARAANFWITPWQYKNTDVRASAFDSLSLTSSRRTIVSNLVSTRGEFGAVITGAEELILSNSVLSGNDYGVKVACARANAGMPKPVAQCPKTISFDSVIISTNAYCGVFADGFEDFRIGGTSRIINNGQKSELGPAFRAGVCLHPDFASKALYMSDDVYLGDTQQFRKPAGASFQPGATGKDGTYDITLIDPQNINVGQTIRLKDAAGPGRDVVARVVALNEDLSERRQEGVVAYGGFVDQIAVRVSAQTSFSAERATPLAGVASSSGLTLTGLGSSYTSQIRGHVWISAAGQWRRVAAVRSDTQLVTETPFSPPLPPRSVVSLLAVDVIGIPSQSYGLAVQPAAASASRIKAPRLDATGVTIAPSYPANLSEGSPSSDPSAASAP